MNLFGLVKKLAAISFVISVASPTSMALAQAVISKPVRVITPFPAGSGPDAALRLVAENLSRKWGQPVVVDNKPGGNGFIAITSFKGSAPDQHTLLLIDSNHATTHPSTFARLPYDVEKDFIPIGMILRTPFFVAVAPDSPYKSLDDLVTAAKVKPNAVTYGSWFTGSPGHIGALQLQAQQGVSMLHVPYRDFGQLYAGVFTKEVSWALGSVASAGGMERAGKLRFLAIAAPKRDPLYPDVPSTAEMPAYKNFEVSAWAGLFGMHGTPQAAIDQVAADLREVLLKPDVVERYRTFGYEAPQLNPAAFSQLIRRETASWASVIKSANLKLD